MLGCTKTSPTLSDKTTAANKAMQHHRVLEGCGYKLLRKIGEGAYSTVHEAYAERWQCNVAVKIISKKQVSQNYLRKFLPRELQVMKTLRHKNIIKLYQSIETSSYIYLVEELATKGDAADWIFNHGPCPEALAKKWFTQMSEAVAYMHKHGIAHRDLKLENLLIDKEGNLKVADFGFATSVEPQNLTSTCCGTLAYQPPELLRGEDYSPFLFDVWSMGVILYHFITGKLPFPDQDVVKLYKKMHKKLKFPSGKTITHDCKLSNIHILHVRRIKLTLAPAATYSSSTISGIYETLFYTPSYSVMSFLLFFHDKDNSISIAVPYILKTLAFE
ncbi:testis-specific serine/threonine-protein kinase 4-like [Protopterus annectens]|uniref:testis-specific serine/threonine-protein kinase 4-like n=1 Tax=Protopterus annectens TaxID=7888 RepID=UPI001CFC421A|nr:testis-specific serine/threonine-protein kinase 4-like [Protopterus annectens]